MSRVFAACALAAALFAAQGCKSGVTESDTLRMRQEFSEENYKKRMYEAGRGAEYEAEKKRQEAESGGQGQ
jgi:uncharacterized protein (DUF3084 family)